MTLHDLFTLMNLSIGTLGHANDSITLQILPGIILSTQFISTILLLCIIWIIIKSSSSSGHLHLQVIFIYKSSSFGSRSSLDLDHHH